MTDNYDYIRCHMPSGRRMEALIPSLLSPEDHDWLMRFVALLKVDSAIAQPDLPSAGAEDVTMEKR